MNRFWLITWTCYGTWLPGDDRNFVSFIEHDSGERVIHNEFGTPFDADIPRLEHYAKSVMTGAPIALNLNDAKAMVQQYQETCRVRGWELQAASVMFNHTHVVVGVPDDPDPQEILETFKGWATRAVKKHRPLPPNGTYWTARGSKRKLQTEERLHSAVVYVVRQQPNPLVVWYDSKWQSAIDHFDQTTTAAAGRARSCGEGQPGC